MGFGAKTLPLWLRKRRGKSKIRTSEYGLSSDDNTPLIPDNAITTDAPELEVLNTDDGNILTLD